MNLPRTNHVDQTVPLDQSFGENAALLQTKLGLQNWRVLLRYYAAALGIFLVSAFVIIVVIRAAFKIF